MRLPAAYAAVSAATGVALGPAAGAGVSLTCAVDEIDDVQVRLAATQARAHDRTGTLKIRKPAATDLDKLGVEKLGVAKVKLALAERLAKRPARAKPDRPALAGRAQHSSHQI